jgi:hypothetical protein
VLLFELTPLFSAKLEHFRKIMLRKFCAARGKTFFRQQTKLIRMMRAENFFCKYQVSTKKREQEKFTNVKLFIVLVSVSVAVSDKFNVVRAHFLHEIEHLVMNDPIKRIISHILQLTRLAKAECDVN